MQVVYSGGTTPNPSPGRNRKGYGHPIQPGYKTHVHPQVTVQKSREDHRPADADQEQSLRDHIPAMGTGVAVLCLLLNIFLPGTGTMTAGMSLLCSSRARPVGSSRSHCMWVNVGVGAVQFFLTFIFLMGWIWSVMWGVAFISIAREFSVNEKDKKKLDPNTIDSHGVKLASNLIEAGTADTHRPHSRKLLAERPTHDTPGSAFRTSSHASKTGHHHHHHHHHQVNSSANGEPSSGTHVTSIAQSAALRQPIIALQQIPGGHVTQTEPGAPNEALMKAGTRKMKILKRKLSDNDLSPFVLTHQQLEAIVIHDLPVIASSGEREEEGTELPKTVPS